MGCQRRRGGGGTGAGSMSAGRGGGGHFFFFGAEMPTKFVNLWTCKLFKKKIKKTGPGTAPNPLTPHHFDRPLFPCSFGVSFGDHLAIAWPIFWPVSYSVLQGAHPGENSAGGRGIKVGVIALAISPLTPPPPTLDIDQEAQNVGVLDGEGGGDGAGGGASRIMGGDNFTSLLQCSRLFIQSVKSTFSDLKSCNPVGGTPSSTA